MNQVKVVPFLRVRHVNWIEISWVVEIDRKSDFWRYDMNRGAQRNAMKTHLLYFAIEAKRARCWRLDCYWRESKLDIVI